MQSQVQCLFILFVLYPLGTRILLAWDRSGCQTARPKFKGKRSSFLNAGFDLICLGTLGWGQQGRAGCFAFHPWQHTGEPPTTASLTALHLPPSHLAAALAGQQDPSAFCAFFFFTCYSLERGLGSPSHLTSVAELAFEDHFIYIYTLALSDCSEFPLTHSLGRSVAHVLQEPTAAVQQE